MHLAKRNPGAASTAAGANVGLAKINSAHDTDNRELAQRRLALKLAAGAGLSIALASVLVLTALGDGRPG